MKPAGAVKALQSAIFSIFKYPLGVLRGLFFTLRLGGSTKRFFYFIEALMVGAWMSKKKLTHLHAHFGLAAATAGMIVAKTFPFTYSLTIHDQRSSTTSASST